MVKRSGRLWTKAVSDRRSQNSKVKSYNGLTARHLDIPISRDGQSKNHANLGYWVELEVKPEDDRKGDGVQDRKSWSSVSRIV